MTFWTDERTETMRKLWADGWSASMIAEKLGGATRNAVISKAHRLGIQGREEPQRPGGKNGYKVARPKPESKPRKPDVRTKPIRPIMAPTPVPIPVGEVPATARPWLERALGQCAYPVAGEGADTWSCCAPTDRTYCAGHAALMYSAVPLKAVRYRRENGVRV